MARLQCRICGDWFEDDEYVLATATCEEHFDFVVKRAQEV